MLPAEPRPAGPAAGNPAPEPACAALKTLVALLLLCLAAAVASLAWVCDDAYITFRTVENALAGFGLRWNVAERVQTYTHPLWMGVVLAARSLTGELYFTAMAVGAACSLAAAVLLCRAARSWPVAVLVLGALLGSRAFGTYATSGLENGLTFLLLALLCLAWSRGTDWRPRLFAVALLTALLATNRLDAVLLAGPALFAAWWSQRSLRAMAIVFAGLLPLFAWLAFATIYYGTPLPNTAHAKALGTGIDSGLLAREGLRYLGDVVTRDPATALAAAASLALAIRRRGAGALPLVAGALLYCLYLLRIGGDFMALRFAGAPLVLALGAGALAARALPARRTIALGIVLCASAFLPGVPDWMLARPPDSLATANGKIIDERAHYHDQLALRGPRTGVPQYGAVTAALQAQGITRPVVEVRGDIGMRGYQAGPQVHIVDPWLCDPLLVRLPAWDRTNFRVGHYTRRIPEGYLESLVSGENRIVDPYLRQPFAALREVTRGELGSRARFDALVDLWFGEAGEHLAHYAANGYRNPPLQEVAAAELEAELATPALWCFGAGRIVHEGGLDILLTEPRTGGSITLWLDACDVYDVRLMSGTEEVLRTTIRTSTVPFAGYLPHVLPPLPAGSRIDRVAVRQGKGDDAGPPSADLVWAVGRIAVLR